LVVLVNVWLIELWPVACALPPVTAPAGLLTGFVHVYVVPAGTVLPLPSVGVTVKAVPLHMIAVWLVIDGFGLTVTVTVNVLPAQVPDVGVTVYVAVTAPDVVLINVPLILLWLVPAAPPVNPVPDGVLQLYVVPAGTTLPPPFVGVTVNPTPLHTVAVCAVVIDGCGLTVTVTANVLPAHVPDVGVTVYVSVAEAFVVFVNVWLIELWPVACALPPVTAPTGLLTGFVHVYVVPTGTMLPPPLAGVTVKVPPLHTIAVCAVVIDGFGLTVTVTVNVLPAQLPDVGVTV
jgi:hypothetical protein